MTLRKYQQKRDFEITPEPRGKEESSPRASEPLRFVVHKHQASHLNYDFRLEWNGVLLSWAVPKGPSLDPSIKRLAMQTEDHPIEYADFEGVIPEGQYGGGTVMAWDKGTWVPEVADVDEALRKGDLKFTLRGSKLKGSCVLVRTGGRFAGAGGRASWLLIKHRDESASKKDITLTEPRSVITNRLMAEIARDAHGNVEKAATADPPPGRSKPAFAEPPAAVERPRRKRGPAKIR